MLGRVTLLAMHRSRIRGEQDSTLHSEPSNESQEQDKLHKPPPGCLVERQNGFDSQQQALRLGVEVSVHVAEAQSMHRYQESIHTELGS